MSTQDITQTCQTCKANPAAGPACEPTDQTRHHPDSHPTPGTPVPAGQITARFPGPQWTTATNLEQRLPSGFRHVACPHATRCTSCLALAVHQNSIIVAVDGACPTSGTKAGCGAFFGDNLAKQFNMTWKVRRPTSGGNHTSQRAELEAALGALEAVETFVLNGGQWPTDVGGPECRANHVVIKSDSRYLVDGITARVAGWIRNGWKDELNSPVGNWDLWMELVEQIHDFRELGCAVEFWLVDGDDNTEADRLAVRALVDGL